MSTHCVISNDSLQQLEQLTKLVRLFAGHLSKVNDSIDLCALLNFETLNSRILLKKEEVKRLAAALAKFEALSLRKNCL